MNIYTSEDTPEFPYSLVTAYMTCKFKDWLWDGIIAFGEICVISAAPFSGKSACVVGLSCAAEAGEIYLGKQVQQCSTLYIAYERRDEVIRRILPQRTSPEPKIAISEGLHINEEGWIDSIQDAMDEIYEDTGYPVKLVVIDTFIQSAPRVDENSSRDVAPILTALTKLAQAGIAVVVIHHPSKGGKEIRGSSAIESAVDRHLSISKGKANKRCLEVVKANSGSTGEKLWFELIEHKIGLNPQTNIMDTVVGVKSCDPDKKQTATHSNRPTIPDSARKVLDWLKTNSEDGAIERSLATKKMLEEKLFLSEKSTATKSINRSYKRLSEIGEIETLDNTIFILSNEAEKD